MSGIGGIFLIVRRSLLQHGLATAITAASVALGCGLLMSIMALQAMSREAFASNPTGFDGVIGPRGSDLQLVLNSVFHMEKSTGNIPWKRYLDISKSPSGRQNFKEVIPLMVGDSYRGHRVVGTLSKLFTKHKLTDGRTLDIVGQPFDDNRKEAVVGSLAAERTGLKIGKTFTTTHGVDDGPNAEQHTMEITVTGILKPTHTPLDQAIWIPMEVYFRMPGHDFRGKGDGTVFKGREDKIVPDEQREISAMMVRVRGDNVLAAEWYINKGTKDLTLALISPVMAKLFEKIAWINRLLTLVAYMVIFVAGGSILASIYNTMNDRRRQFAIFRALGARRQTVFGAIVLESAAIAGMGAIASFAVYAVILMVVAYLLRLEAGVVLNTTLFHPVLILGPLGVTLLGALAGTVPAWKAYSTDVATNLVPST
jgi:putative ABC transport system permease protein